MYEDTFLSLPNDKERMAFLDSYQDEANWYLAKMLEPYDRRFFAYPGDGYTIYVEDELQTVSWPKKAEKWISKAYFLVEGAICKPFADYRMSKTQIINWVKERRKLSEKSGG